MRDHNHHNQGKGCLRNTRQTCRRVLSSVSALIAAATLVVGTTTHPVVADASPAEKAPYDASAPQVPTSPDSKKEPISPAINPEAAKVASLVAETATDFDGANTSKQADPHAKEADNSIAKTIRAIPRCGLRTALVFDVSQSIGQQGLAASKEAGKTVVDILSGTSTTLSIMNFATEAPGDVNAEVINAKMESNQDVNNAKQTLDRLTLPGDRDYRRGGTNWSDALKRLSEAADNGEKYDVVYFITDGRPTAPFGWGVVTNDYDVIWAQYYAEQLRSKGTYVVGVGVGFRADSSDRVEIHPNPEYGQSIEGAAWETTYKYRHRESYAATVDFPGVEREYYNDYVLYVASQLKLLETISQDRIILPNGFEHLREELRKSFAGCGAKLVIKKELVDASGKVLHNSKDITTPGLSGAGFEFTSQLYKTRRGGVEKVLGPQATTDDDGIATLTMPTLRGREGFEPGTIEVSENLQNKPGWSLFLNGKQRKAAVCTAKDVHGTSKTVVDGAPPARMDSNTIYVEQNPSANGLTVRNANHLDTVECTFKNVVPAADFVVNKEKISEPIALTGEKDQRITAEYRVKVRNNASHQAQPGDILEAPQAFPGMNIAEVHVSGELVTEQNMRLAQEGNSWLIPHDKMQPIGAHTERSMTVAVTYVVTDPDATVRNEKALTCRSSSNHEGVGLVNTVALRSDKDHRDKWKNACVDLKAPHNAAFTLSKKAVYSPVVVTGAANQELTATYEVAVKNDSAFTATPQDIIEEPTTLSGMNVIGMVVSGDLVTNPAGLRKEKTGSWRLAKADMKKIQPQQTATMRVEVRYRVADPKATRAVRDHHQCVDGSMDKGLVNQVKFASSDARKDVKGAKVATEEKTASACVSVAMPELTVDKEVYTQKAYTKEQAYPLAPTAKEVQFTYRFGTGSYPLDTIDISDVVMDVNTGAHTDQHLTLGTLQCTGATVIPGSGTRNDAPRLAVDKNHHGEIVCHTTVTDPKAIPATGAYTHTQINAQAHYTVPAYQATAPEQEQPLTGSASAWVFKFPAMVGEMPRSGGFGPGGYIGAGMFTVLLAAGLAGIVFRRQRTTE